MISPKLITRKDAAGAGVAKKIDSYYQEEKDDYYTRDKQPSQWYGKGAAELGLSGSVEKQQFTKLLMGEHNGQQLRQSGFKKKSANDRLALDVTFNAPKSVSLQALVGGDKRLLKAHHEAVKESLDIIEGFAQARQKRGGKTHIENTNNLAIATFRHDTNRNNDPHLHTHSVILNFTKREDNQYRALHNDQIIKNLTEASQAYQANLAKRVKDLGYDVRLNGNGTFDLAHISKEQIKEFSTRSTQIENNLAERGLSRETATQEQKQAANFLTKQDKRLIDKPVIQKAWSEQAQASGLSKVLTPQALKHTKEQDHERERKTSRNGQLDQPNEHGHERDKHAGHRARQHARRATTASHIHAKHIINTAQGQKTNHGMHAMPSRNVAKLTRRFKMLLPYHAQLQLHKRRANSDTELRRSNDSVNGAAEVAKNPMGTDYGFSKKTKPKPLSRTKHLSSTKTLSSKKQPQTAIKTQAGTYAKPEKKRHKIPLVSSLPTQNQKERETLKDMMHYQAPTSDTVKQWGDAAKNLDIEFKPGKTVMEDGSEFSGKQLAQHVIRHLSDKKVQMTKPELTKEIMLKGLGAVNHEETKNLVDNAIREGDIIKAEPRYYSAQAKTDKEAKTRRQWVQQLQKDGVGEAEPLKDAVNSAIESGRLIQAPTVYVTKEALDDEKAVVATMREQQHTHQPFQLPTETQDMLKQTTLNDGQKRAAELILNTRDGVVGIQGYAGVGKSYTLGQILPEVEKTGADTHVLAPYGKQVKSLRDDGLDAHTVAKFINSEKMQEQVKPGDLIVMDEAGVSDNKNLKALLTIAKQKQAKVVLLGDTSQTKAVGAGKPFDLLKAEGMDVATIDDIQRQKNEQLKKAVVEAAFDEPEKSVKTLGDNVMQFTKKEERLDYLAEQYAKLPEDKRNNTLVVTGTNEDKHYLNDKIRENLGIKDTGVTISALQRIDRSREELKHARYFEVGETIEFQTKPKDKQLQKDTPYEVVGKTRNSLIIAEPGKTQEESIEVFPNNEKIAAYLETPIEIAKNDKLKVVKGNSNTGLVTGESLTVVSANKRNIVVSDDKGKEYSYSPTKQQHLAHDYASTVHAAQGQTVDNVMINIDTKSRTTSKEVYYVAVSRAKHSALVVTDDKARLPNKIKRATEKHSAYELTEQAHKKDNTAKQHTKNNEVEYAR